MFIGHYGVALAAKRITPGTSLGALFVAVQFLDVVFASLVIAGVEKMRIVPGFTRVTPYDLYFMPFSHSFAGALLWAAAGALGFGLFAAAVKEKKARVLAALVFGGAIFSHVLLDFPVHVADLPLGFEESSPRIGLGLWDQVDVTLALELGLLVAGGALYAGGTEPRDGNGTPSLLVAALLIALAIATPFLPPPAGALAFALEALFGYLLLAIAAEWMDRSREPSTAAAPEALAVATR